MNRKSTDPLFQHLEKRCPELKYRVRMRAGRQPPSPEPLWEDILAGASSVPESVFKHLEESVAKDDVANIQFTSGTTGAPKAAMLTHL